MQTKRRTDAVKGRRNWKGFFPDNAHCLPGIPRDSSNWKEVVSTLCGFYNTLHASKAKHIGLETTKSRRTFLFRFFRILQVQYPCDPRNLKPKHIEFVFSVLIKERRRKNFSNRSLIHQVRKDVAALRFFARWIGKLEIVRPPEHYLRLNNVSAVPDVSAPTRASKLSAEGVELLIAKAREEDLIFGNIILALARFGLRPREACHLKPLRDFREGPDGYFLRISEGSKGGKPRDIPFTHPAQYEAMFILETFASSHPSDYLGHPGDTPRATQIKLEKFGREVLNLKRDTSEGTVYSLRHYYAQLMMVSVSEYHTTDESRIAVSEMLGHHRPGITGVYVGSAVKVGGKVLSLLAKEVFKEKDFAKRTLAVRETVRHILCHDRSAGVFAVQCALGKGGEEAEYARVLHACGLLETAGELMESLDAMKEKLSGILSFSKKETESFLAHISGKLSPSDISEGILKPYFLRIFSGPRLRADPHPSE